jgi:hypothetical protein
MWASYLAGAISCFERVVEANPHDASAHYHLGVNYKRQGLDALAMSVTEALKLDPSDTAAAEEPKTSRGSTKSSCRAGFAGRGTTLALNEVVLSLQDRPETRVSGRSIDAAEPRGVVVHHECALAAGTPAK